MQLRDYQAQAHADLLDYFRRGEPGHPLVVAPTGSGKSLLLAAFCEEVVRGGGRVLLVSHVREILEQDAAKLEPLLGASQVGLYCAGLGRRDVGRAVTIASVQSVYRHPERFGPVDVLGVDEAHLVPHDRGGVPGMYLRLVHRLREANPDLRVVGWTATPFRTAGGWLHEGPGNTFTDVAASVDVLPLIDAGWLSDLTSKSTAHELDVSGVAVRAGDYVPAQLEAAVATPEVVRGALGEALERGRDRHSWLVFACGVRHAHLVAEELAALGVDAGVVTGTTPKDERAALLDAYRAGDLRALVNVNVLTTGFDAPATDLLVLLRPTRSPVLHVQMLGRAMRPAPGKRNALVLDFAGNVRRLGPINAARVPRGKAPAEPPETAPAKECPSCGELVAPATRECPACGHEWPPREAKHHERADLEAEVVARPRTVALRCDGAWYERHEKEGRPPSLQATYLCGYRTVREWVCLQHGGYATQRAREWWVTRAGTPPPETVDEAIQRRGELRAPEALWVKSGGKYDEVVGVAAAAAVGEVVSS